MLSIAIYELKILIEVLLLVEYYLYIIISQWIKDKLIYYCWSWMNLVQNYLENIIYI